MKSSLVGCWLQERCAKGIFFRSIPQCYSIARMNDSISAENMRVFLYVLVCVFSCDHVFACSVCMRGCPDAIVCASVHVTARGKTPPLKSRRRGSKQRKEGSERTLVQPLALQRKETPSGPLKGRAKKGRKLHYEKPRERLNAIKSSITLVVMTWEW